MSNYNEGARGRARYWMERAQQAEAECERLREALKQEQEKADEQHMAMQLGWRNPPESEPTAAQIVEAQQWPIGSDALSDPEQAHGDALAACNELDEWLDELIDFASACPPSKKRSIETIREALTASGVPYVPESIRNLSESWRRRASNLRHGAKTAIDYELARSSEIHAEELEAELVSASADGYKMVPVEPTPQMLDATWDHDEAKIESHNTRNHRIWSAMIASAPSDE